MISAFRETLVLAAVLPLLLAFLLLLTVQLVRGEPMQFDSRVIIGLVVWVLLLGGTLFAGLDVLRRKLINRRELADELRRQITSDLFRADLLSHPSYQDPKHLGRFAHKAYSQNGEDGILAEIFQRIGTTNRHVVEFGAGDGLENNSCFLLLQGWYGLWMEADPREVERAQTLHAQAIEEGRLQIRQVFITAENVEALFRESGVPPEGDLLSIDIDRNDYYIWQAIQNYRPRVVVIEYNAIIPPTIDWVIEYAADKGWDGTSHFGASLKALERLGREKGYSLVACDMSGVNAFFVRSDLVGEHFKDPFTAETHFEPPRYWLAWGGHQRQL